LPGVCCWLLLLRYWGWWAGRCDSSKHVALHV
jgi:hypothetical protein